MARFLPLPSNKHIRLLELSLDESALGLSITMHTTLLEGQPTTSVSARQTPSYLALSYLWGTDRATHPIMVNGWPYLVRDNLYLFLSQFKQWQLDRSLITTVPAKIWIDAICINQEDEAERNVQVQRMGQIYQQAHHALIWLGPGFSNSRLVMQALRSENILVLNGDIRKSFKAFGQGLQSLTSLEYWFRAWIVQEFILSADIRLACGPDIITLAELETFKYRYEQGSIRRGLNATGGVPRNAFSSSQLNHLLTQRKNRTHSPQMSLLDFMVSNRHARASESRDKVYAMLGLVRKGQPGHNLRVAYKSTTLQLIADTLSACNVSPIMVVRYTRFLYSVLTSHPQGDSAHSPSMPKGKPTQQCTAISRAHGPVFNVVGFYTGRIIDLGDRVAVKNVSGDSNKLADDVHNSLWKLRFSSPQEGDDKSILMQSVSVALLKLTALQFAIGAWTFMPRHDPGLNDLAPLNTCQSCRIYFDRHIDGKFCIGLILYADHKDQGLPRKGDLIVQFLGHDVFLLVAGDASDAVKGFVVCTDFVSRANHKMDPVTQELLAFGSICHMSEMMEVQPPRYADLPLLDRIRFHVHVDELIALVSGT